MRGRTRRRVRRDVKPMRSVRLRLLLFNAVLLGCSCRGDVATVPSPDSGRAVAVSVSPATVVIAPSQVLTMMIRSGELSGLWPLTLVLSAILSAPFVVSAFVGSRFRPRQLR